MPAWIKSFQTAIGAKQNRAFLWVCLFFLLFAAADMAAPLDNTARAIRDKVRAHPASGEIVLMMPDDPSDNGMQDWSWTRADLSELLEKLRNAGVARVAIARPITERAGPDNLAQVLQSFPERPLIAMRFDLNPETGQTRPSLPPPDLAKVADVAVVNQFFDGFGRVEAVPYRFETGGEQFRSMASWVGHQDGPVGQMAPIDYAIDLRSIPVLSSLQVATPAGAAALDGKTILIASVEARMNAGARGRVSAAYAHVLGAETLAKGRPVGLGWYWAFLIAIPAAAVIWFARRGIAASIAIGTALGFLLFPIVLETRLIFIDTISALLLVLTIATIRTYRGYRSAWTRENNLSGLPNLTALKEASLAPGEAIVVAKVANYAELMSVVTVHEQALVQQIVARLSAGGDPKLFHGDGGVFAWIVRADAIEGLGDHLDALHAFFLKPAAVGSWQVDVTMAFGVNISSGNDMASCFACASVAADEAVARHMRWTFYDSARLNEAEWNVSLLGKLDSAIESGEVWVAYQPQIDIASGCVTGFEALVRWTHPERGAISPEQFISVAETHGRIDRLTYFVLDDALSMLSALGASNSDLSVAVNISARMFGSAGFLPKLRATLKQHGIAPSRLTAEITESAAAESEKEMLSCVAGLIRMGVQVSIDDYGTGYSTLEYLKNLKAQELKIDRGFIAGMDRNRSDFLLVKATIDLAHSLGHRVVAEGVETVETMEMLAKLGCDAAQGFLIARPMPQQELADYIASSERRAA